MSAELEPREHDRYNDPEYLEIERRGRKDMEKKHDEDDALLLFYWMRKRCRMDHLPQ